MESPERRAPYLCMEDTRCRLCQFELEQDELVTARIEDQKFSSTWKLCKLGEVYDADQDVTLHACGWHRCSGQTKVPFFHSECVSLKLYDISNSLIAAEKYTFDCYEDNLGIKLPNQILTVIAGILIRLCASVTAQERTLGTEASKVSVDLLRHVYVTYTVVEGVRYVKSISNSSSTQHQDSLALSSGQAISKIWIAEDYRGIRFVKFCSANMQLSGPTPIKESWWRSISSPCNIGRINAQTDGLKLRDITVSEENSSVSVEHVSWASPEHPNHIIDLDTLEDGNEYPHGLRMIPFDCNTEALTGYTVVTDGISVAWIHAHGPNDNTRFYAQMETDYPCGVFIYMPLDNGEFITEICRRYAFDHDREPSICLLFITNTGRATLFGTNRPPNDHMELDRIIKPAPKGSMIYFNAWNSSNDHFRLLLSQALHISAPNTRETGLHRPAA
ncbi:hypothetical protein FBEOM_7718 [Fusarium beomiforme]|uniref:Uncharacterized protein n=1 Tax=Fusarium beomiforme TaxID=44412 RepID=A0A9P5AHB6_9HYPO|nr:hypothetical protein FBEOM_7718 [Fusarium beomiforme]